MQRTQGESSQTRNTRRLQGKMLPWNGLSSDAFVPRHDVQFPNEHLQDSMGLQAQGLRAQWLQDFYQNTPVLPETYLDDRQDLAPQPRDWS